MFDFKSLSRTRKIIASVCFLYAAGNLIYAFYLIKQSKTFSSSASGIVQQSSRDSEHIVQVNAGSEAPLSNSSAKALPRTATEVAVVNEWFDKSGYKHDRDDLYRSYTDDILNDLVNRGDIIAIDVMTTKAIQDGDRERAKQFAQKGIVYGSLTAIKNMAIFTRPEYAFYESSLPKLKESLAYLELLSMRGDSYNAELSKSISLDLFNKHFNTSYQPVGDDAEWIHSRAKELYAGYEESRIKLGLGTFNNDTPEEVKKFFSKE